MHHSVKIFFLLGKATVLVYLFYIISYQNDRGVLLYQQSVKSLIFIHSRKHIVGKLLSKIQILL
jgi:hypothetical protein